MTALTSSLRIVESELIVDSVDAVESLELAFCDLIGAKPLENLQRVAHDLYHALHLEDEIFEGTWSKLPDFRKLKVKKAGTVGNFDLSIQNRRDNFGVVYSGYLKIVKKGEYIFATRSDDGTRFTLAGKELVLNDGVHAMISVVSKPVLLSPGFYPIEVEFFEGSGGEGLEVNTYSPTNGKWSRIPTSMIYRRR